MTLTMTEVPPHGIKCGGRCGRSFTNGDPYVQMLTVESRPHTLTGEPADCYLIYCPDCAKEISK